MLKLFFLVIIVVIVAVVVAALIVSGRSEEKKPTELDPTGNPLPDDPTLVLKPYLDRGNVASKVLTRTYRQLEQLTAENGQSVRVLRASYTQQFKSVAGALHTCYDAKEHPSHYDDAAELNHTVTNALNALNERMLREIRNIKRVDAGNAEAAADFLIHNGDDIMLEHRQQNADNNA